MATQAKQRDRAGEVIGIAARLMTEMALSLEEGKGNPARLNELVAGIVLAIEETDKAGPGFKLAVVSALQRGVLA